VSWGVWEKIGFFSLNGKQEWYKTTQLHDCACMVYNMPLPDLQKAKTCWSNPWTWPGLWPSIAIIANGIVITRQHTNITSTPTLFGHNLKWKVFNKWACHFNGCLLFFAKLPIWLHTLYYKFIFLLNWAQVIWCFHNPFLKCEIYGRTLKGIKFNVIPLSVLFDVTDLAFLTMWNFLMITLRVKQTHSLRNET
jgi:hypothetical protein